MKKHNDETTYKAVNMGLTYLSDTEVVGLIVGQEKSAALRLSDELVKMASENYTELTKRGLTHREAIILACSFELGRRKITKETREEAKQLTSSKQVHEFMYDVLADLNHEEFWAIHMNRSNKILKRVQCSIGGISGTVTDVRLICKEAILLGTSAMIVLHNHPSGGTKPSQSDIDITKKLNEALKICDVKLLDHVIFTNTEHFSFADEGLL